MDLLAPCRSCLQCLPFFHVSPPSSPRLAAAAAPPSSSPYSQQASKATSSDPPQSSEELPCPKVAIATQEHDLCLPRKEEEEPQDLKCEDETQEQDLCLPRKEEEEAQDLQCDKDESVENFEDEHSTATESEVAPVSGIVIAPPVSASGGAYLAEDPEDNKSTTLSELPLQVPFINDITFSSSGFLPLQSPITPAPFGAGYPAGQYPPAHIYQGQHHEHGHSHHRHENSHDDHNHSLHSHEGSHHEHANSLHGHEGSHHEHANSHHGHDNSHNGHDNSHIGQANFHDGNGSQHSHVHGESDYEVPLPHPPSDNSQAIHELHEDTSHDHVHTAPDYEVALPLPPSDDSQVIHELHKGTSHDHPHHHASFDDDHPRRDQIDDIFPTPPLETSESTPDLDMEVKVGGENSAVSDTNGASALLETFHSEPAVVFGDLHDDENEVHDEALGLGSLTMGRRRRRDHFKNQFKGIKQQIKQGGHHIKEEGSKHMQTIIENMNKQAQQAEQSGSFFMVPRANNN